MRIVIVGGVAAGMSAAARARRLDETAEIIVLEKGSEVSFANCGLPYHVSGEISEAADLLLHLPSSFASTASLQDPPPASIGSPRRSAARCASGSPDSRATVSPWLPSVRGRAERRCSHT